MDDRLRQQTHVLFLIVIFGFLGCNRPQDQTRSKPAEGTKHDQAAGTQSTQPVAEKLQPKVVPESAPAVASKGHESKRAGPSFSLERSEMPGAEQGNVHNHFVDRHPVPNETPFLAVWTDARSYSGGVSYPSANNIPLRKYLAAGNFKLRFGSKDNDVGDEVEYTFEITDGEKGQLTFNDKSYDFGKGALFLVSGQEGELRVQQLSRDSSKLPMERNAIVAFGNTDPDIKAFFSKSAVSR